ncbi:MAG: hypothetical protein JST16_16860 [Bdellovibrionales bacterium]|nr:hypothetical protein [Bdellovibrionales bacterium]
MKRTSFFQRLLLLTLVGTIVLVLAGFAASFMYMRAKTEKPAPPSPPLFLAHLVQEMTQKMPRDEAFRILTQASTTVEPNIIFVIDDHGKLLFPAGHNPEFDEIKLDPSTFPTQAFDSIPIQGSQFSPPKRTLIRLSGEPARFLVLKPRRGGNMPPPAPGPTALGRGAGGPPGPDFMPTLFVFVLVSALLSALLSFATLMYYLRKNSIVVEGVISELHSGNLKARLPVKKLDEFGRVMLKFNEMADEIERLVGRIRENEKVRIEIVQELGHDLRTPIASLRTMLETLSNKLDALSNEQKIDIATTSVKEVVYMGRLVDDLLFLACIDDPQYRETRSSIDVRMLLENEVDRLQIAHTDSQVKVSDQINLPENLSLMGDPHLFRRMIRNALDNAFSFARTQVTLRAQVKDHQLHLSVEDDGPGIPAEILSSFGYKRMQRSINPQASQRISLGLGSVIMRAIVTAHRGSLQASNRSDQSGARIDIQLPLS